MTRRTLAVLAALGAALVLTAGAGARSSAGSLTGAGSTFVAPLVQAWIPKVDAAFGVKVTYGPIGSGGGINAITNRTVDFGASDAPLTPDQFAACKGCTQIPWALSATSLAYRGDGIPNHIKLDGSAVADIFLGRIKKWNDPALKKLNKGKSLPNLDITVIHRSDNSGTTYNLTDYLNSVSPQWKSGVGKGVAVNWPTGVGARGQLGCRRNAEPDERRHHVRRRRVLAHEPLQVRGRQEPRRRVPAAGASRDRGSGSDHPPRRARTTEGSRSSIRRSGSRSPIPICTFTYVIVPKQHAEGGGAQAVHSLGS